MTEPHTGPCATCGTPTTTKIRTYHGGILRRLRIYRWEWTCNTHAERQPTSTLVPGTE